MRIKIFFFILLLASLNIAQITLRGGVNYNSVTAGAFTRLGYENKPIFSGYYFGFGLPIALDDRLFTIGFDYASASANIKYESTGSTTELNFWNVPFYALIQMEAASNLILGFQVDLVLGGFSSDKQKNNVELSGMYGAMRIGAEAAILLGSMFDVYALASINLGYTRLSKYSDFPVESSDGLASGPEIKIGTRMFLVF